MRDLTEILIHWQKGRPNREIARSLGVDPKTVRKYVGIVTGLGYQQGQANLSSQEWAVVLQQQAPELVDPAKKSKIFAEISGFHQAIVDGLTTNCPATIWQRLHDERGLQASLRSFRRYLGLYVPDRPGGPELTVLRDDPPPGKEAQIDFGYLGLWPNPSTGKRMKLWAFLMVLSHSRHMFVYVVNKMDQPAWIAAHVAAFEFLGGVPAILVIDNLKAGVIRPDLYDPRFNRGYEQMANHYGTLIDPCRAGHPKDKPRVERPISYVRDSFFAGRNFGSLDEINEAAEKWCLCVAGQRIHGTTRRRPFDVFQQVEASALLPLPQEPFELVTWTRAKVADDCHVQVGRGLYSLHHRYWGKTVDIRLTDTTVEFYLNNTLIKTRPRLKNGGRDTDWNDYPPEKARFYQRHPDWCRAKAKELGPEVAQAVEDLLSRHALHFLRQCQGIIGLGEKYEHGRLNAACQRALAFGDPSYKTIKTILHKGLDGQLALPVISAINSASAGAYLHGPEGLFAAHCDQYKQEESNG